MELVRDVMRKARPYLLTKKDFEGKTKNEARQMLYRNVQILGYDDIEGGEYVTDMLEKYYPSSKGRSAERSAEKD